MQILVTSQEDQAKLYQKSTGKTSEQSIPKQQVNQKKKLIKSDKPFDIQKLQQDYSLPTQDDNKNTQEKKVLERIRRHKMFVISSKEPNPE